MKRPKTNESKYWDNDRFRHLLFIEDLEDYTTALEEQIVKNCSIPDVGGSTDVVWINETTWIRKDLIDEYKKFIDTSEKSFFHKMLKGELNKIKEETLFDRLKWAWVKVGNTKKMCWVDNKTMKAYKADGYEKTYMEIPKFTFERWCTSFDL